MYVLINDKDIWTTISSELRGPDIGSDHNLMKINFKVKLRVKTGNKYNTKRKMMNFFSKSKVQTRICYRN